jgi:hypothetical protein
VKGNQEDIFSVIEEVKQCSKCKEVKPLTEFHKDKHGKDGLKSHCNACIRVYKQNNKEHTRKLDKIRNDKHNEYWKDKDPYEEKEKKGITEKRCPSCSHISGRHMLPIRSFSIKRNSSDGLKANCKGCESHRNSKRRSKKKHKEGKWEGKHDISLELWLKLTNSECVGCGHTPTLAEPNSVDRRDSSIDYEKYNVQPFCDICNKGKLTHPHDKWVAHCAQVTRHNGNIVISESEIEEKGYIETEGYITLPVEKFNEILPNKQRNQFFSRESEKPPKIYSQETSN